MNLGDWSLQILEELIKFPGIESERLDFKSREMGDLTQALCAMANTNVGMLILGIGEIRENGRLQGFEKDGWDKGEEDAVNRRIGDHVYNVEPKPNVSFQPLYDSEKFYMVLKVEPVIRNRPYIVRGTGACYVRVGSGSFPASRDTFLSLCKLTIDRTESVLLLQNATKLLVEQLEHIREQSREVTLRTDSSSHFLPEADTGFFQQAGAACMWFLSEYDLLTAKLVAGPERRHGFYSSINFIQELNQSIRRFNMDHGMLRGNNFSIHYTTWEARHMQWIINYLTRLIEAAQDFVTRA